MLWNYLFKGFIIYEGELKCFAYTDYSGVMNVGSGNTQTWVWMMALPFGNYINWGKFLKVSMPYFIYV